MSRLKTLLFGSNIERFYLSYEEGLTDLFEETNNVGIKNMLQNKFINDLNDDGKYIVEWCVDYILLRQDLCESNENNYNLNHNLDDFIVEFLKIPKSNGNYNNYIMYEDSFVNLYLDYNNIIANSYSLNTWDDNPYKDRIVSEERKEILYEWITQRIIKK